jgi:hypothetical protein
LPLAATQSSVSLDDPYGAMALERLALRQDQQVEELDGV